MLPVPGARRRRDFLEKWLTAGGEKMEKWLPRVRRRRKKMSRRRRKNEPKWAKPDKVIDPPPWFQIQCPGRGVNHFYLSWCPVQMNGGIIFDEYWKQSSKFDELLKGGMSIPDSTFVLNTIPMASVIGSEIASSVSNFARISERASSTLYISAW